MGDAVGDLFHRNHVDLLQEMNAYKNEVGNKYDLLTVERYYNSEGTGANWLCRCRCGNVVVVKGTKLRSGNTRSCGCLKYMSFADRRKILSENRNP